MESQRLNYIRKHKKKLRVSKYCNLSSSEQNANTQGSNKGKRVVLPSTYVGSRRFMEQLYFDGMEICSQVGFPNLFITFTCNPNWPEIQRYVVPYNPYLLKKLQAHINMEWCNQSTSVKYLFKYINKGYDRIIAVVVQTDADGSPSVIIIDEIKQYLDCRYVSPSEACWRLFSFPIHGRSSAVERLFFHFEGDNSVYYTDYELIDEVLDKPTVKESMFTAWMEANKAYPEAKNLTYSQFLSKFFYDKRYRRWRPCKRGNTIGRLIWVPPSMGELYFLRMMLTIVKGPTCYEDIKFVGGKVQDTFRDACFEMGFLNDDKEYVAAIDEAKNWGSGHFLRKLFVTMLLSGTVNRPRHVWEKTWRTLSDSILYQQMQKTNRRAATVSLVPFNFMQPQHQLFDLCSMYFNITTAVASYIYSDVTKHVGNRLIYDELDYDDDTEKQKFQELFHALTDEQRSIFEKIMDAVNKQSGGVFFLHGYGGTGKTFMWITLSSALRSQKKIVLTAASSGIASLLLPGGRTAHSKFKIPVPKLDNSTCNIDKDTEHSQLFEATDVIIWDEAPMSHKNYFKALDKTLKDVMSKKGVENTIFGGKVVVFGGDFRQILPVVPRAGHSDIVHASISSSYVWDYSQVLTL
ncbi:uncharacterized protein LOC131648594 [Vicia villosa]|uniref:uncharacterized protein LOC131648594 n=1 Tax=Vicia villosa TaxID=3911 RepID=UPI00273C172E|nr:uncharacterized protein LOC131648594 [Vicia villosa]